MNRGSDSILSVYSDARAEYTKQLCVFLVPAYFQFFIDLLEKSKQDMINEPKKTLWNFQNYLNEIHDWNMEKVNNEIHKIYVNCGCDYLDDLLTAVFIAHTKVLTAIRLSSNKKKIEINVPKVEHFLFKVLCETSKLLWSSTYLFRDGIPGIEKQQNYRNIEQIINEGILAAVRSLVPVKSILKDFVNNDTTEEAEEESDDDDKEEKNDKEVNNETEKEVEKEDNTEEKNNEIKKVIETQEIIVPQAVSIDTPIENSVVQPIVSEVSLSSIDNQQVTQDNIKLSNEIIQTSETIQQTNPPPIIIDDKPTVRFGEFDAVFDTDNPHDSDMIYEPKDNEDEDEVPVLEILDEKGTPLSQGLDFDDLDEKTNENLEIDDYESL
jgi:hypothetical protein